MGTTEARAPDPRLAAAERGCLVIADISGYTGYLAATELEHAQDVLADLTETVVDHLQPVLRVSKLEGDAAFAYALEERIEASMLLDTIEESYFAFQARLRDIREATSCECNACLLIPTLNLKFVAHHGSFVRRPLAGWEELTGRDVIVVHRLLKNSVADVLGLRGYALFTERCIEALGVDPSALDLRVHDEEYDDVGEVTAYVEDLETRWAYEQERRRVFVVPGNASFEIEATYEAPPAVVWEYLTSPSKRLLWGGIKQLDEEKPGGRRGAGTTNHCVHGRGVHVEEIVDWKPFRYYTMREKFPFGPMLWTTELEPLNGGTRMRMRGERLHGKARLGWAVLRRLVLRSLNDGTARLGDVLREQGAAEAGAAGSDRSA